MLVKSANAALKEIGKWMAPEKASKLDFLATHKFDLHILNAFGRNSVLNMTAFGWLCCVRGSAGLGAVGGVPGERAGRAGAARGRPHLLLLELPLG